MSSQSKQPWVLIIEKDEFIHAAKNQQVKFPPPHDWFIILMNSLFVFVDSIEKNEVLRLERNLLDEKQNKTKIDKTQWNL